MLRVSRSCLIDVVLYRRLSPPRNGRYGLGRSDLGASSIYPARKSMLPNRPEFELRSLGVASWMVLLSLTSGTREKMSTYENSDRDRWCLAGKLRNFFRRLSKDLEGCRRLSKVAEGCRRLSKGLEGCRRLTKVLEGCRRLTKALEGCRRIWKALEGCRRFSKDLEGCRRFWSPTTCLDCRNVVERPSSLPAARCSSSIPPVGSVLCTWRQGRLRGGRG